MGLVTTTAFIRRPIAAVFDTATTARYWPQWHPATRRVSGATDHPVRLGEQITEVARIAGMTGTAHWTCVEYDRPRRLVLAATGTAGARARIVYTFVERDSGVEFTRDLTYRFLGPLTALLEPLLIARVMQRQSQVAMENLKALIEVEIPAQTEAEAIIS